MRWLAGLTALGALAFALRAVFVFTHNDALLGGGIDSLWYGTVAAHIAHGEPISYFWSDRGVQRLAPTATHGILFPLVLGGARALGATSLTAQKLVGCGLGACTAVAVGVVGRELGSRPLGLVAAGLVAISPQLIMNDSLLMSEPLYGLLCALAVLSALRLRRRPGIRRALVFGITVGLAALTRSEGMLLLPFLGIPLLWEARDTWRFLGVAAATAALVMSPWVIRNWKVFGRPALTTNTGSVWVGGNCHDTYYGTQIGSWSPRCLTAAATHGLERNELDQSDRWSREGRDYALRHGDRLPVIAGARILRTFNLYPLDPGQQARAAQQVTSGPSVFYLVCVWAGLALLALAAIGWRFTDHEARLATFPLVVMTVAVVAATESLPRLKEAADIALVLIAAHGLTHLLRARLHLPRRLKRRSAAA